MVRVRKQSILRRFLSSGAVAVAIVASAFVSFPAEGQDSQPPSASDIADGMRLYQQKGNCQACHGWAGDGRKTDSQMPDGANLRDTKLNRAGLVTTIKCGRLNSQMPAFGFGVGGGGSLVCAEGGGGAPAGPTGGPTAGPTGVGFTPDAGRQT